MRLVEIARNVNDVLKNFKHKDAAEYAKVLIKEFGEPDQFTENCLVWYAISQFDKTYILDESVPHDFPATHRDYVYSVKKISVSEKFAKTLAHTTGSIIVDGLKKEVIARCGSITANAITLGFVQDLVDGKIKNNPETAKKEYGRRILKLVKPEWFDLNI